MPRKKSAGDILRVDLQASLQREATAQGRAALEWDERERQVAETAIEAADAVEMLTTRIDQAAGDPTTSPSDLVKLLAERRQQRARMLEALKWLRLPAAWSDQVDPQRAGAGRESGRVRRPGRPGGQ